MKLLLIPVAIVAFVVFLLVLGAIGFAVAFSVLAVLGRGWRLISGGRRTAAAKSASPGRDQQE